MKHFVFHLISVILLIVLFLITLDLTRAKQVSQNEVDELTKKCAEAEQTLEKERADAAVKAEKAIKTTHFYAYCDRWDNGMPGKCRARRKDKKMRGYSQVRRIYHYNAKS